MRRREFLRVLGSAPILLPRSAHADPPARPVRVGVLMSEPARPMDSFREEMRALGYSEGKTLHYEYRFARGFEERYPALASELVALDVDVIVTWGTPATLAAKRATRAIPIIMAAIGDPVSTGIVSNFAAPGENITGFSTVNEELEDKRLELLKDLIPQLSRIGVLSNANSDYAALAVSRLQRTGAAMGLVLDVAAVQSREDIESNVRTLAQRGPNAVVVVADSFLTSHHQRITKLMAERGLPAIYAYREAVEGGGLMAYAANYNDLFRRAAIYTDKVLNGVDPGTLPVQQAARFELIINTKAASALGISVPDRLLERADEVIE
jgi:putative tryptophan/tyrosine transport system substrate-binding protein